MSVPKIGRRYTNPDLQEQGRAADALNAERAEQAPVADAPLEQNVPMTPVQIARAEEEKRQLVEALRVPAPAPALAGIATGQPTAQPVTPAPLDGDPVADAQADVDAAVAMLADANARLDAARVRQAQAVETVQTYNRESAAAEAHRLLTPLVAEMRQVRGAFLALAQSYGFSLSLDQRQRSFPGALATIAKTLPSGSVAQRNALIGAGPKASAFMQKIQTGHSEAVRAEKAIERAMKSGSGDTLYRDVALKACESARACDPAALREEIAAFVAWYENVRQGLPQERVLPETRVPEVRITLDDPADRR